MITRWQVERVERVEKAEKGKKKELPNSPSPWDRAGDISGVIQLPDITPELGVAWSSITEPDYSAILAAVTIHYLIQTYIRPFYSPAQHSHT